jgi:hypothetical protein
VHLFTGEPHGSKSSTSNRAAPWEAAAMTVLQSPCRTLEIAERKQVKYTVAGATNVMNAKNLAFCVASA